MNELNPFYERELQKFREIGRNFYFEMSNNFHSNVFSLNRAYEKKAQPYFWLRDFQMKKICERYINLNDSNYQIRSSKMEDQKL